MGSEGRVGGATVPGSRVSETLGGGRAGVCGGGESQEALE